MTASAVLHGVLHGVLVPLVTPFTRDGDVAVDALQALAHDVLDGGATGVVALGTTSEAATLDREERLRVVEVCARVCREHAATLMIGAGTNDTRASGAALAELARWPGSVALVPVPYYTRPSELGVVAHFTRLAAASPVPLVIYHIPYRTARTLGVDTLRTLAAVPGVVGVKYSTGVLDAGTVDLLGDPPPGFAVLAGDDALLSPMLALGAAGGVLAAAQLATCRFAELVRTWRSGDLPRARPLGAALARLAGAAFAEPNPTVVKGVLHAQGRIPTPDVRLPLLPASPAAVEEALARVTEAPLTPLATTGGGTPPRPRP